MATKPTPPCTPAAISLRPMSAPIEKLVLAGTGSIRIDHDTGNIHYRPAQYRLERLLNGDVVVLPVR